MGIYIFKIFTVVFLLYLSGKFVMGGKKNTPSDWHPVFRSKTKSVPNWLSIIRFPMAILIIVFFYFDHFGSSFVYYLFHLLFWVICALDFLDGEFARKYNAITEDGKSLDPAADKFVSFCLGGCAFVWGELRWWALCILVVREVWSVYQRRRMKVKGRDVSAKWLGKLKTVIQFTVLYILLMRIPFDVQGIGLEVISRQFSSGFILWLMILFSFCTIISLFPFFESFSYLNNYVLKNKVSGEKRKGMLRSAVPNAFTLGNYICGVTAVYFAMPEVTVDYRPFVVLFWVFAAALCDAIDGPMARKFNSFSDFGACIDSSTDLSTFGLASSVVIFLQFSSIQGRWSIPGLVLGIVFFVFVHLRLRRFSSDLDKIEDKGKKPDFVGMPSPTGAMAGLIMFTFFENIWVLTGLILSVAFLMYSRLDFVSHSNAFKRPIYKYTLIPLLFLGFGMFLILVFAQPFVSAHMSRELIDYFRVCSGLLLGLVVVYIIDGLVRTFQKRNPAA